MKSFLEFLKETEAKRSYDPMVPSGGSYYPSPNRDRGIGDTVPNNAITDETEDGKKYIKKKKK